MFLIMTEFNNIYKTYAVEDYLPNADEGKLRIFDITNPEKPLDYIGGQWIEIEDFS